MSSSGVITDVTNAIIRQRTTYIEGVICTQPALKVSDGESSQYAADVQLNLYSNDGRVNQTKLDLEGVPGGINYNVAESNQIGTILRNVPIVSSNAQMIYATVGTGVYLTKTSAGRWQITGLTMRLNGTQMRYGIHLPKTQFGGGAPTVSSEVIKTDLTLVVRPLYLGEIALHGGGFGVTPFGATAIFVGGVFQKIHS